MKNTKIVCTLGPATDQEEILEEMMLLGMNVCRLNFSHGNYQEHKRRIDMVKKVRDRLDLPVALMLDTKGPEIRLGDFKEGEIELKKGQPFTLTTSEVLGDESRVSVSYPGLVQDVKVGDKILIDDGLIELDVTGLEEDQIHTTVYNPGKLSSRKGVNIPYQKIHLESLTDKDREDILFGIREDMDFIAASFIRKAQDVLEIRKILEDQGASHIGIIAKIESQEGVDNLEEIVQISEGIMVARGDLGVEIPMASMPIVQKEIIRTASEAGKVVITATQMLDSMIRNPRPTRAEVADVANAIIDGTDAIMLSGETAAGNYPLEAVRMMKDIALETEKSTDFQEEMRRRVAWSDHTTTDAISLSTWTITEDLHAKAIISATTSGATARAMSKFRPPAPIIAATYSRRVMRQLAPFWGIHPVLSDLRNSTDEVIDKSIEAALLKKKIAHGDLIIITAGIPVGITGMTNMIRVHTVGNIVLKGQGIGKSNYTGRGMVVDSIEDKENFKEGDVLIARATDIDLMDIIERAGALVVEEGGLTSHGAIVGLHLHIPTIVGVADALNILKSGELITVDAKTGLIYKGSVQVS